AQDAYGNPTPEYQGTVHFISSDPAALLPADYAFTDWDYGSVELSAVLRSLGTHSITATDTANPAITGSQTGLRVVPVLTIGDATVTEGNTGTRTASFVVTLPAASSQAVTVDFATYDGTAIAGSDYQAARGTLTRAPGQTSQTVTVLLIGDRLG